MPPTRYQGIRPLRGDDLDSWLEAASKRKPPRPKDRATLRAYLQRRNAWKFMQLQRLLRWAEKELGKTGLNPEDARWII